MMILLKIAAGVVVLALFVAAIYGANGYLDALHASEELAARADQLIVKDRGASDLGTARIDQLLQVQDPGFWSHAGVDLTTPGAGITTMTQSLAKRVGFKNLRTGFRKIRQTGYALGLEQRLSKQQIIALFLDTAEMGRGPEGWMTGFFKASEVVFGRSVAALENREFLSLVAVMISPARFDLLSDDSGLADRLKRIERLVSGRCTPNSVGDVWLEGCA